jgi:hypothetical protein
LRREFFDACFDGGDLVGAEAVACGEFSHRRDLARAIEGEFLFAGVGIDHRPADFSQVGPASAMIFVALLSRLDSGSFGKDSASAGLRSFLTSATPLFLYQPWYGTRTQATIVVGR